ncbi:MAG TPA: alpha/beta fold hydrolase [Candidatus Nitrosotenuis sp.]
MSSICKKRHLNWPSHGAEDVSRLQRLEEIGILKSRYDDNKNTVFDLWYQWMRFSLKYNGALFEAASKSAMTFFNMGNAPLQKIRNAMRASFDSALRERLSKDDVAASVARLVESQADFAKDGSNLLANYSDFISRISQLFEPFRDTMNRTPSDIIWFGGRFCIHHYKSENEKRHKTPILVVYSLINRHYILDLLPDISIINNLLRQGFDVYATDWGTPVSSDKDMSLENYAHEYVENAVDKIKEISGAEKVTLFGYCWGGIFALLYSCLHPESVKNLILHATPTEIEGSETVIERWTAEINADKLVEAYGNVPGFFLNLAFVLRNPAETLLKYWRYFSEPRSMSEILQFFSIETWLYDSVPIIGGVYREVIDQIYKENLLIKNKMKVDDKKIDLNNITMPVLSVIGTEDDLVPSQSSKKIMDVVSSSDKKLIEFPTGHVGLCISQRAHEKLWPEVGSWLASRS